MEFPLDKDMDVADTVEVLRLGTMPYRLSWDRMLRFTEKRTPKTADQLWLLEHPSVFTAGRNTHAEHFPRFGSTPVVKTDRGGQITWHGPGQLVVYLLLDLRRRGLSISALVRTIEGGIISVLAGLGIEATRRKGAPGVYAGTAKVAALGLRVRRGCCYHGLSLNVHPDLQAFEPINPCGYPGLAVTSLEQLGCDSSIQECAQLLVDNLVKQLGYQRVLWRDNTTMQTAMAPV